MLTEPSSGKRTVGERDEPCRKLPSSQPETPAGVHYASQWLRHTAPSPHPSLCGNMVCYPRDFFSCKCSWGSLSFCSSDPQDQAPECKALNKEKKKPIWRHSRDNQDWGGVGVLALIRLENKRRSPTPLGPCPHTVHAC